jgi:hypothetical protein
MDRVPYYVIDDVITTEEVATYLDLVKRSPLKQGNKDYPDVTASFWGRHGTRLTELGFTGILPTVTVSKNKSPLPRHTDQRIGAGTYKVLIYLNEVPAGGTVFYLSGGREELIENRLGRMVLFNIGLPHASQVFSRSGGRIKYTIGFRIF